MSKFGWCSDGHHNGCPRVVVTFYVDEKGNPVSPSAITGMVARRVPGAGEGGAVGRAAQAIGALARHADHAAELLLRQA